MKVKELITVLEKLDPETKVLLSSDPEGNVFSELSDTEEGFYLDHVFHSDEWTADDCCMDEDEWNQIRQDPKFRCITLFP